MRIFFKLKFIFAFTLSLLLTLDLFVPAPASAFSTLSKCLSDPICVEVIAGDVVSSAASTAPLTSPALAGATGLAVGSVGGEILVEFYDANKAAQSLRDLVDTGSKTGGSSPGWWRSYIDAVSQTVNRYDPNQRLDGYVWAHAFGGDFWGPVAVDSIRAPYPGYGADSVTDHVLVFPSPPLNDFPGQQGSALSNVLFSGDPGGGIKEGWKVTFEGIPWGELSEVQRQQAIQTIPAGTQSTIIQSTGAGASASVPVARRRGAPSSAGSARPLAGVSLDRWRGSRR